MFSLHLSPIFDLREILSKVPTSGVFMVNVYSANTEIYSNDAITI